MLRIVAALCFVAGLALALNVSTAGAQYAGTAATVSIRALECADESGQNCDRPLVGVSYAAAEAGQDNGVGATTGADGRATLTIPLADDAGMTPIVLSDAAPQGYERYAVSCVYPETGAEVPVAAIEDGFVVDLAPGDLVACDWAYLSTGAGDDGGSVTIYKTACPAGYGGDDYYGDCYDNPQAGVSFSILRTGTDNAVGGATDAGGGVAFPLSPFAPGSVSIFELSSGRTGKYAVFCTKDGGATVVDLAYGGSGDVKGIVFDAEVGDEVRCDWFNIPAPADPTPTPSPAPSARPSASPTPRVGQLPDTGTGGATDGMGSRLLPLLLAGGFVALAVVAVGRRRQT